MTTVAVIPARFGSTRFPAKMLAKETGKYLVQHVYERAIQCPKLDRVIVATDDERILSAVKSFNGDAMMTKNTHLSGTDRVGEVAGKLNLCDDDLVLNVQGDEPELHPSVLTKLVERMQAVGRSTEKESCGIGTIAAKFSSNGPREGPSSPLDPNRVKVVVDSKGQALYFSRSMIPFPRSTGGVIDDPSKYYLHLGVYAFRPDVLRLITGGQIPPGDLEKTESLEQLRWLEAGLRIRVVIVDHAFVGVDTPADYAEFVARTLGKKQPATTLA
ncbi:MAG: 3-deoxy-manno-octulosonate cytidylyltransferase [Planctomycetota bacterium]